MGIELLVELAKGGVKKSGMADLFAFSKVLHSWAASKEVCLVRCEFCCLWVEFLCDVGVCVVLLK